MGMEFRPYYLAQEWIRRGHSVTIIAGDYSHLRKHNPEISEDFAEEVIDGIQYLWVKTGEYEGNGVARALTMFRFCRKISSRKKKIVDKIHPDVVISSSTYPLDSYPAEKIARLAGARYIHEVHDMWPSTLYEIGGMSKANPFVIMMQKAENHAYRSCDELVSLLSDAKEYMVVHGLAPEKFHCLRNGIVESEWSDPDELPTDHKAVLDKLREENKFVVGYFGGHALSNNLDFMIDAADIMRDVDDVAFVLVGGGVEKQQLIDRVKEMGLSNVLFLGPVNKRAVPSLLRYFDASFIAGKDSPLYRFGICMNKMFDSMMAGIPIVMAISAASIPIEEAGCGIVVRSSDAEDVVAAIEEIRSKSVEERTAMGANGHEMIIERYTYSNIAEEFEKLF